jgi:hypothetical protein
MNDPGKLTQRQYEELLKPFEQFENDDLIEAITKRDNDRQINLHHTYIRARLIEIFGPFGWGEQDLELTEVGQGRELNNNMAVAYRARQRLIIRNSDGSVRTFFDGAGAWGTQREIHNPKSLWDLHSDCMNGARSVAFCRAAKNLGTQFGLSFYTDDRETIKVRYSLPHRILQEQAEMDAKAEQLDLDEHYTPNPDESEAGFDLGHDPAHTG